MNPKCVQCSKEESILWRKNSENEEICNECFEDNKLDKVVKFTGNFVCFDSH